jgi:hypothetical protein
MPSRRLSVASFVLLAGLLCVGLSGCFASDQTSNPSSAPTVPATASPESVAPGGKIAAVMTIAAVDTNGENVSVSGYVSGIVEDDGTCDFVVANAATGKSVDIAGTGISNARTTSCGTSQEPIASFTRGSWTVTLHYKSTAATVVSTPINLEIP